MKSLGIIRTNVGLTGNVKILIDSEYNIYLDSIPSVPQLEDSKYKKVQFTKESLWDEMVPFFFKNTPIEISFSIRYGGDSENMGPDFSNQYDDIYQSGARNIVDNKYYDQDYEYFAPLYVVKDQLPRSFVIFRVDGPGLISLNRENFGTEILDRMKCVKVFDLTRKTPVGEWMETNITKNVRYPKNSLYVDFRKNEFSSWTGIDYDNGGYPERSFLMDSFLEYENTFYDFEKFVIDGYKNNRLVYPNIINFGFLFDDQPATPTSLRKWSVNRYMGFYLENLDLYGYLSPYRLPELWDDVVIDSDNFIKSPSKGSPFKESVSESRYPYVEVSGMLYPVTKVVESELGLTTVSSGRSSVETIGEVSVERWKILSDVSLSGKESLLNKMTIVISTGSDGTTFVTGEDLSVEGFSDWDVWILEIDGIYHRFVYSDGGYRLLTDYGFSQTEETFDYYVNSPDPEYRTSLSLLVDQDNSPKKFGLYRCRFSPVSDFDTDIVDTGFSHFEYEKKNELTQTDEPKLYPDDIDSTTVPKELDRFGINGIGCNIPVSSEYTANNELFRIVDSNLSPLWRKNPVRLKWGYRGSLSVSDYPYLLNNSFTAETFNGAVDVFNVIPDRPSRNLDYFLTVNPSTFSYLRHSCHVDGTEVDNFGFDLSSYLRTDFDYFDYFFGKKSYFDSGRIAVNTRKFSYFDSGDNVVPNVTLWRGMKFSIKDIDSVQISDGDLKRINVKCLNTFENWKFSVLLSKNDWVVEPLPDSINSGTLSQRDNVLRWQVVEDWTLNKNYASGSVVRWYDILWTAVSDIKIVDPDVDPFNSSGWTGSDLRTIFWSPNYFNGENPTASNNVFGLMTTNMPPLVYNSDEYYYSSGTPPVPGVEAPFWNPYGVYNSGDPVLFKNEIWVSQTSSNSYMIDTTDNIFSGYWTKSTTYSSIWTPVELWDQVKSYTPSNSTWNASYFDTGHYVVYEGVVYSTTGTSSVGVTPEVDSVWNRVYSVLPDTNFPYGTTMSGNSLIQMNNRYYRCVEIATSSIPSPNRTLENGIVVYINEKWKNVLVNITVNDNTLDNLSNADRDMIYGDVYGKLTAGNFMSAINDPLNKYQFADNVKYVVVGSDGSIGTYDFSNLNSVVGLPYLMSCEYPDLVQSRIESNLVSPVTLGSNRIKSVRELSDSNITSLDQLNWYSGKSLATTIERIKIDPVTIPNYNGNVNLIYNSIYRYSGNYDVILREIPLFLSSTSDKNYGNTRFDTDLSDFGMTGERIVSKVNRNGSVLKLRNEADLKSQYPMLDEFGYSVTRSFLFKSTWDFEYHEECSPVPTSVPVVSNETLVSPSASYT